MSDIFSSDSWLNMIITEINDFLWTYILIAVLVGCGLWFTWRTRFVQFRMLKEMIRLLGDSSVKHPGHKHISSFQAFAVSVATRVGTGNLAGVATAIAIGGPGAVFWMWIIALIGSATAFVESTLAQLFKLRHKDSFIGGPAYYIQKGMHNRWMSALFAILITITFGLSYNSIQSNTICQAMNEAFGWNQVLTGIVLVMMSLAIVFGGIQRIAKVSSVIVPVMAIGYFILAFVIVLMNIHLMPHVFKVIISVQYPNIASRRAAQRHVDAASVIPVRLVDDLDRFWETPLERMRHLACAVGASVIDHDHFKRVREPPVFSLEAIQPKALQAFGQIPLHVVGRNDNCQLFGHHNILRPFITTTSSRTPRRHGRSGIPCPSSRAAPAASQRRPPWRRTCWSLCTAAC